MHPLTAIVIPPDPAFGFPTALYSEHMLADLLSLDKKLFLELLLGSDNKRSVNATGASISKISA